MFSLLSLLYIIPFPFEKSIIMNWSSLLLIIALLYYLRLSFWMLVGFAVIGFSMLTLIIGIHKYEQDYQFLSMLGIGLFTVAWVFQFIGHKIEGEKPSFIDDLQFLLIGPAWLLHFIYNELGLKY
jgi:uncharacterized membrane protein YGL010W